MHCLPNVDALLRLRAKLVNRARRFESVSGSWSVRGKDHGLRLGGLNTLPRQRAHAVKIDLRPPVLVRTCALILSITIFLDSKSIPDYRVGPSKSLLFCQDHLML